MNITLALILLAGFVGLLMLMVTDVGLLLERLNAEARERETGDAA